MPLSPQTKDHIRAAGEFASAGIVSAAVFGMAFREMELPVGVASIVGATILRFLASQGEGFTDPNMRHWKEFTLGAILGLSHAIWFAGSELYAALTAIGSIAVLGPDVAKDMGVMPKKRTR